MEHRLGLFQVRQLEALGEPVVVVGEHGARFIAAALFYQQLRKAGRCAQLEKPRSLSVRRLSRLVDP